MATKTASVSGNWSNTATWGGSPVPVDGDLVVINSNVAVEYDMPCEPIAVGTGGSLTATGVCAASVLTDAAKGWTVNAYVGYALYVLGVPYPITANTATTITVTGTLPTGTWSYDIHLYGAAGLDNITAASHATTPGSLTFTQTSGRFYLPIKTGKALAGSNASTALQGIFKIGTSGTPINSSTMFKWIQVNGTGVINTQYLKVEAWCDEPTNAYAKLNGAQTFPAAGGSIVFNLDRDLSADALWAASPGTDVCVAVVNFATGQGAFRRGIVTAVGSSTITVLSPPAATSQAMAAGSYVVLMHRPVMFNSSTGGGIIFVGPNNPTAYDNNLYLSGVSLYVGSHAYQSTTVGTFFNVCNNVVLTGKAVACQWNALFGSGFPALVDEDVVLVYGTQLTSGGGVTFKGLWIGGNGQNAGADCIISGTILHCGTGWGYSGHNSIISGTIQGCGTGLIRTSGLTILESAVIGGTGTGIANTNDFAWGFLTPANGYGCRLRSSTPYSTSTYKFNDPPYYGDAALLDPFPIDYSRARLMMYDYAIDDGAGGNLPQYGQIKMWALGGTAASEAAPGSPPVTLAFAHKMNLEVTNAPLVLDIPIILEAGTPLSVIIYHVLGGAAYSWTTAPKYELIDISLPYGDSGAILATAVDSNGAAPNSASTAWQTLYLKYTLPIASNRPLGAKQSFVLRATGRVSSTSGSPYWHWNYTQNAVVNANVQYIEGVDDVAGWMAAVTQPVAVVP